MSKFIWIPFKTANHIVASRETFLRQRARSGYRADTRTAQRKYRWCPIGNLLRDFFHKIRINGHLRKTLPFHADKLRRGVCQIRQADKNPFGLCAYIHPPEFSAKQLQPLPATCPANPSCSSSRRFNPSTCAPKQNCRHQIVRLFISNSPAEKILSNIRALAQNPLISAVFRRSSVTISRYKFIALHATGRKQERRI